MDIRRTFVVDGLPGGDLELPYFDVRGPRDGPHLVVVAGIHGTEYTSMAAVREFAQSIDPDRLAGRITAVPIVNLPAFWARTPFVVPADGRNLNRCFPGDLDGSYSEILAAQVFHGLLARADAVLDLHAGDLPESLEPFCLYQQSAVDEASRALALAYGLGHVVRQKRLERTVAGSTCAALADLGIPAIIAESGQNGLLDRASVEAHLRGMADVARHLGLLPGPVSTPGPVCEHDGWHWLRTPHAGWWEPAIGAGSQVAAGALLGTVSEITGGLLHEARAPEDGVVLFLTSSPAVLHEGLLLGLARD